MFDAYAYTVATGSRAGVRFYVNGSVAIPFTLVDLDSSATIETISLHGIFKNKPSGEYTISMETTYTGSSFALSQLYLTIEVIQN